MKQLTQHDPLTFYSLIPVLHPSLTYLLKKYEEIGINCSICENFAHIPLSANYIIAKQWSRWLTNPTTPTMLQNFKCAQIIFNIM